MDLLKPLFDILLLILAFLYAFLLPGFIIVQIFYRHYPHYLKIPLYILISILVSTWATYFLFYLFGQSRIIVIILALFTLLISLVIYFKHKISLPKYYKKVIVIGFSFFVLFLTALFPSIFRLKDGNVIMGSVNWQDTAMHLGIIESIAQGNFPPQAPYYAGVPLTYYYFVDFHSSLINFVYNNFFPRVLVYTNPVFTFLLFLSVFAFAYELTKDKKASIVSSFFTIFFSSYSFLLFLQDIAKKTIDKTILSEAVNLVQRNGYSLDYGHLFQVVPVADYLLQNRPMMVGLSSLTVAVVLVFRGLNKNEIKTLFLAGLIIALTSKFQFFALVVFLSFCTVMFFYFVIRKRPFFSLIKSYVIVFVPVSFFVLVFNNAKINGKSIFEVLLQNFKFDGFGSDNGTGWIIKFVFANFGVVWLLFLLGVLMLIIKKRKRRGVLFTLVIWAALLITIPFTIRFTVYEGDMFKFFYFASIPMAVVAANTLQQIRNKWRTRGLIVATLTFFVLFLSPALLLANSFLNENVAYTQDNYQSGLWIRKNTPTRSVFLSMPTVHSPVTQIGGRLRVLSYITWPYSHGYNEGEDNVFRRRSEIESVYANPTDSANTNMVLTKYRVGYILYGNEESDYYPNFKNVADKLSQFEKVYEEGRITIYKVNR